ncbi:hypothetical protein [Streptomyces sp. NPDC006334]|uniref:hypothetical protein n=1 Tax=Streptomyces sp. NPDC006334 TaxID=3156754 RepID=UPI0033A728AA
MTDKPDEQPRDGVRIEYRATVPLHLLAAAIAEAVDIIDRETQQQDGPPAID